MKLGARIFKTGIAIVFALFIADVLSLPNPVFAGIAAIFAIQPTIYRSYLTIVEQIQGNLIGAITAVIFVLVFGHQIVTVGFAAVIIILVMLKLGLEKSVSLALVTMIAIMEIKGDAFLSFATLRFVTIVIGVLSAFIVNLLFMPPKYETKLFQAIHQAQDEIIRWIRLAGRQASEHVATKKSLDKLKERLTNVNQLYTLFKEERSYFKRNTMVKARKLVIYRQMIAASESSHEVLFRLHKFENELLNLPEHFRMMIQERLDSLLTYHEQIHLKFVGKLKSGKLTESLNEDYIQRQEVMDIFAKEIALTKEEEEFSAYHLLHVLSALLNYDEQLEHLDRLIVSNQRRHGHELSNELREEIF
ncbi:aromatic acid exporter family protein [Sporosarcina thermotolerans]|uniref:Aromatic acid exporter family protein n=1 Tax=Sporosarcina thermotolerans TaxID=633404 RepID=A0AAW9AB22_9BACL|nr:aromatic acid exporter family protein [Sporosarcina thermotolerans]MDW0117803.1 aromatic acid exporter family protein [Sporosarcina thermotolerans]WHT49376.1 aromatic acid exporter family protein [Sporosarcina thermotolerans]